MRFIDADALKAEWPEPIDWMDREQVLRHITWFRAVIDNMPTIDPVKWIPVSERLPEKDGRYLVTCEQRGVADAKYWHRERIWVKDWASIHVTAWMPLPEPWKGEEG